MKKQRFSTVLKSASITSLVFSFAAVLLGLKFWLISTHGSDVPFVDQWGAEGLLLYQPFLTGELTFDRLLSPHNEHRILFTRLLGLLELNVNGLWSPLLQMVVNALVHVVTLTVLIFLMANAVGKRFLSLLFAFALAVFAAPNAWENTISGFQSCFYLVLLFSITAIWMLVTSLPFAIKWWVGIALSVMALCCWRRHKLYSRRSSSYCS